MRESPQMQKLEEILRSSKLVAGGFMGSDSRIVSEIVDADAAEVSRLGLTIVQVAARMQAITDIAKAGLGNWVKVDDKRQAVVAEAKGSIVCPWPHLGRYAKRVTTLELIRSGLPLRLPSQDGAAGDTIRWSDLNIHLIAEHGFFEGRGSAFRIEPAKLIKIIF